MEIKLMKGTKKEGKNSGMIEGLVHGYGFINLMEEKIRGGREFLFS